MDLYSPTDIFYFQDYVFPIVGQTSSGYHKKQFILSSDLSGITAGQHNLLRVFRFYLPRSCRLCADVESFVVA